jgi:hypothetical protein
MRAEVLLALSFELFDAVFAEQFIAVLALFWLI